MANKHVVVKYPTIPLSGTVSDPFDISGMRVVGIWVPTITSASLLLRASFDTTSANYVPVWNPNATPVNTRWGADVSVGSVAISVEWPMAPFASVKLETSQAQAAVRSFAVICKLDK